MPHVVLPSLLVGDPPSVAPASVDSFVTGTEQGWYVADPLAGARSDTQPVNEPGTTQSGYLSTLLNDAFYNRVIVEPAQVDLGNIVAPQAVVVKIWNGTVAPVEIQSLAISANQGVTYSGVTLPKTLQPGQQQLVTLNVAVDGPAALGATLTVGVSGATYSVALTGSRAALFPFAPQWRSPVNEILAWSTDVQEAFDGTEQRISLRTRPRRQLEFEYVALRQDAARLDNLLYGWQNRAFGVPVWPYKTSLTQDAPAGTLRIYFDTTKMNLAEGQTVALYRDASRFEAVAVASVYEDGVLFLNPLRYDWFTTDIAVPVSAGQAPTSLPRTRVTDSVVQGRATFDLIPQQDDPFIPATAAPVMFRGAEIVYKSVNWASAAEAAHDFSYDQFDGNTGALDYFVSHLHPKPVKLASWRFKGKSDIEDFRAFLGRRRGRQCAFWMPTWTSDFELLETVAGGSNTLRVTDNGYASFSLGAPGRDALLIRVKSGFQYLLSITNAGVGTDGVLSLTVSGLTLPTIKPSDVVAIHLVCLYRLAADQVTLSWITDDLVDVSLRLIQVPA